MNIKALYQKYKDIIPYGIFGVLTTLVNVIVYWASARLLGLVIIPGLRPTLVAVQPSQIALQLI